ncbi:hypothetical protein GCM10012287_00690 [Streptomyces daqingensis]|uniref:SWF or SNF family helicase n=1 Tax=Streptomyces daqingensis TaxID=1472640 RepID=A0ABQ2LSF8_9ACTN|nr:SWF or SNF family helicase [Streptomyces daqingensis]GGO41599.1 hypothetical protein GCM10012287_00690 [Streptomyces daqingensis]
MTQPHGEPHGQSDGAGERERTFAALPPARGRAFARTWWGTRWLQALEDTALDGEQLRKGRRFARQGAVGAVTVRPGRITAVVRDRDGTAHRSDVLLQELPDADWERVLEVAARESGHLAALLDGEMPPRLVEDALSVGVELLPGIGDLDPSCGCEAWDHCPHTAALSYQLARLLDEDPFVLLLLRGRTERELLEELGAHTSAGTASAAAEPAGEQDPAGDLGGTRHNVEPRGVLAEEVFARGADLRPLPAEPPPGSAPGGAPSLTGAGTQPASGVDAAALEFLIAETASRAHQLLCAALSPAHAHSDLPEPLTPFQDAVRLAASAPRRRIAERLSAHCGVPPASFGAAVRAWEVGGELGLTVWEESWTPAPETMAWARDQLATAWAEEVDPPGLNIAGSSWNTPDGSAQLRIGPDGSWWPYVAERGVWWPAGGAQTDPAAALAVALRQKEPGRGERD